MKERGFSLIELMIVVVIMAILAAIAVPIYVSYGKKARRTAAINALQTVASREEGYYSRNNQYATSSLTQIGYAAAAVTTTGGYYQISVAPANTGDGYIVTATPQGSQSSDSCGTFKLDSLGNETAAKADCWPP